MISSPTIHLPDAATLQAAIKFSVEGNPAIELLAKDFTIWAECGLTPTTLAQQVHSELDRVCRLAEVDIDVPGEAEVTAVLTAIVDSSELIGPVHLISADAQEALISRMTKLAMSGRTA